MCQCDCELCVSNEAVNVEYLINSLKMQVNALISNMMIVCQKPQVTDITIGNTYMVKVASYT